MDYALATHCVLALSFCSSSAGGLGLAIQGRVAIAVGYVSVAVAAAVLVRFFAEGS
jgi:hypothetical protein